MSLKCSFVGHLATFSGNKTHKKMRLHKIRVIIFLVIFGMFYVSFKILEPEIDGHDDDNIHQPVSQLVMITRKSSCVNARGIPTAM